MAHEMRVEVTPEAADVLQRSLELARLDPSRAGIRLRSGRGLGGGLEVQVELAEAPLEGDRVLESGGVRLFVDPVVAAAYPDALVAVDPQHDVVTVRPRTNP